NGQFQFIGIDAWSNQQDFTENSKPLIVNSIASEPSSPIWEPFRDHIMGLTLNEAKHRPSPEFCREAANYSPIVDLIQAQNQCNEGARPCTGNETLKNVTEGTLIRASQAFDNVYIVGKTLADYCADTNGDCREKLALLTGKQFYDMMKNHEINL